MSWHEYVGAVHIHTLDSDGTKSVPEITKLAKKVGLDFLLLSDHLTLKSLYAGMEGWHDNVLAIIGYEIHDEENQNHYLVFDLKEVLPYGLSAQEYTREVRQKGGLGIVAHPDEIRSALKKFPPYPWNNWNTDEFDGIEIWNEMSEWMENLTGLNQLKMVFSPRKSLKSPARRTLERWDEINQKRKAVGIGAIDAHAFAYPLLGLFKITIFPYDVQFKSIRTHVLLSEPLSRQGPAAKRQLLDALRSCQVFVSNYRWGDAKGFSFTAADSTGEVTMGESMEMEGEVKFLANAPSDCHLKLMCDGKAVAGAQGRNLFHRTQQEGNYRIEAYRNKKGWIFSNHIRLTRKKG